MNHKKAQQPMKYNLDQKKEIKVSFLKGLRKLFDLLKGEYKTLFFAMIAIVVNAVLSLVGPFLIGHTVDTYIVNKHLKGTLIFSLILLAVYVVAFVANFVQIRIMGAIGQRVLFNLRQKIFSKLQELPISFFNQNKTGDLISRINSDTDKLSQFFSETLSRFVGSFFTIAGAAIAVLIIQVRLGVATLIPALGLLVFTGLISSWQKERNKRSLQSVGGMSAEISESLNNFKVIVAFNRRDYFREKFEEANKNTFNLNVKASFANAVIPPVYDFAANTAQLIVLCYGIYMILLGNLTLGILISFLVYAEKFYNPLRQMATLWSSFQISLAAWDRINDVLLLESDLLITEGKVKQTDALLEFENVSFSYPALEQSLEKQILSNVNFSLKKGHTYALVGPTGGGKTTTASLMARLFDPTIGKIFFEGRDICSLSSEERTKKIGFILQEPFLFEGTVKENILYGNKDTDVDIETYKELVSRFENGFDTMIKGTGEGMSLGEKQIIAFLRAVVRKPDLLILDEATANIDTITEVLLQNMLDMLPKETVKVIIAHRLNTIENADEIYFVNKGTVTLAGSFEHAVEMLLHNKRES